MTTLDQIQKKIPSSCTIALGNFDGVHRGHREIFRQLQKISGQNKTMPVVLVLYPHPKEVLTGSSPALLTTIENRKNLIQGLGIEHVYDLTFNLELSQHSEEFLLEYFCKTYHMKHLVIGPTTHIGKARRGTPDRIAELSKKMGFGLTTVQEQVFQGTTVSSSLIRTLISRGEMEQVTTLLDRYYSTHGVVEKGMGKGKTIGFPTANLGHIQTMVPTQGVYAGFAHADGQTYKSAINIGVRPTVSDTHTLTVEPHLIDFKGNIVGKPLVIEWVHRLRDEKRFGSIDELRLQIQNDIRKANDLLSLK